MPLLSPTLSISLYRITSTSNPDRPASRYTLTPQQADQRFSEVELQDILAKIKQVFEEEEGAVPEGIEDENLPKIENKLLGAAKKKRKVKRKAREE